ncbi:MAG: pseudouridine-5'-phosphate glycosidase, partial [Gemmatimonadota bacterium]
MSPEPGAEVIVSNGVRVNGDRMPEWIQTSDEAGAALRGGRAVVALESTVVAHGLPRPRNLTVAQGLESRIREVGATPATVALVRGQPRLGLESSELEEIATSGDVEKLSTRDLPLAIARRATGAATVAATAR